MLNDPNIESPANLDASKEFRDNYKEYAKKVRKLTARSIDYIWTRRKKVLKGAIEQEKQIQSAKAAMLCFFDIEMEEA